jgi:hypothetical protein
VATVSLRLGHDERSRTKAEGEEVRLRLLWTTGQADDRDIMPRLWGMGSGVQVTDDTRKEIEAAGWAIKWEALENRKSLQTGLGRRAGSNDAVSSLQLLRQIRGERARREAEVQILQADYPGEAF